LEDPRLLFRVVDGKLEKEYSEISPWAKEIREMV
jgi:hypothetical protein